MLPLQERVYQACVSNGAASYSPETSWLDRRRVRCRRYTRSCSTYTHEDFQHSRNVPIRDEDTADASVRLIWNNLQTVSTDASW